MQTLFKKYRWLQLVLGILLVAAGTIVIVLDFVNFSSITTTLSIVLAVVFFLLGGLLLVSGLVGRLNNVFDLTYIIGSALIAIGVVLLTDLNLISTIIITLMAVLLITFGVAIIVKAIVLLAQKYNKVGLIVAYFILGAALLTLGILAFIFKSEVLQIAFAVAGVAIVVLGITQVVFGIKTVKK